MNKKQFALLAATLVLSTQATINGNATDNEPDITEDEARTLFAMRLRKAANGLIADTAGVDADHVVMVQAVAPAKKAKATETADAS